MGTFRLLFFTLLLVASEHAMAQRSQELTLSGGGTSALTDIGPANPLLPKGSEWTVDYRFQAHPHYAFHLGYSEGTIRANDAQSTWPERVQRNISIQTPFQSVQARVEVDFFSQRIPSYSFQQTPYLFAGMGLLQFNPQGYDQNTWVDLQPLGTEGQGTSFNPEARYSRRARTLPFGLGWRAQLSALWVIHAEATWTLTSTDYLDDTHGVYADPTVVQESYGDAAVFFADPSGRNLPIGMARGNAQTNDAYFQLQAGIGLHLEAFMEQCSSFLHR
ncbi:MAG TPA: hypothetical protein DCL07_00370 [Cryomorphaceae bacterium]|jgi:hypothetical protein|nr:MAG: hypothetical protein ABR98_01560 [Cryomorphaceae bacterium BACL7 MAG-120910-bin2]KRO69395.1 MAG: hypothetical protein ABR88_05295 [Cryomorphaceae bacterium BACL7 MAG-120322-bin74]KRO83246.1 MAG: hypothetical protein ABR87_00635 [Cryomorphaceae bacterium BACL7 MAG-121220-bin83]NQW25573.1 hypothetical protein [Cryomorphaceae bacterium]HAG48392.1 hypothetical protein [Cryomorphaceae bacterium]|tara:strand:- start:1016 stop:1840 length:825 start_codon:yes stop_codon:yes gene_type:complete